MKIPTTTYHIGIDPGKTGAWAVLDNAGNIIMLGMNEDRRTLVDCLNTLKLRGPVYACIEKAHAMPNQGSVSGFTFGTQYGIMQGMLEAHSVSFELVSSNRWQKEVLDMLPAKEVKAKKESIKDANKRRLANRNKLKNATVDFCVRRWSETVDTLKVKKHQGAADALCLALYCIKRH